MNKRKLLYRAIISYMILVLGSLLSVVAAVGTIAMATSNVENKVGACIFYSFVTAFGLLMIWLGRKLVQKNHPVESQDVSSIDKMTETQTEHQHMLEDLTLIRNQIKNKVVIEKITRIEKITTDIFKIVERDPKELSKLRSYKNYYLPTTLKLLGLYAEFEKQSVATENVLLAKNDIERILDNLAEGFEKQLDTLFSDDVIDVSSDIEVLETMMIKEGLLSGEIQLYGNADVGR